MFDDLAGASRTALVTVIESAARDEARAAARRLAAIAEFVVRDAQGPTDAAHWSCDNWDAMAAEVAAALNVSHNLASHQMNLAMALRDRLPAVAGLFADGKLSLRLVNSIIWRTGLIKDPVVLRVVDAALANDAIRYGPQSVPQTERDIDAIVNRYDQAAVRCARDRELDREVVITNADGDSGTAYVSGSLLSTDAAILDRRLNNMAHQVCSRDPRTVAQRRADALGALAANSLILACQCGDAECPSRSGTDPRAAAIVIHVVADPASLQVEPDSTASGEAPRQHNAEVVPAPSGEAPPEPDTEPRPPANPQPGGQILGGAGVSASQLAALVAAGAKVAPLDCFADAASAPVYRPPAAMARFVRCRDMTCRFPGCNRPADVIDIDHTVAYPLGLTHPSNLKCLCRKHHLLKTFWGGATGWRDRQLPDGTVVWTSPHGRTYTTRPGSRLLFPALSLPTGELPKNQAAQASSGARTLMMPTRRRTRAEDRAYRIDAERARNMARREADASSPLASPLAPQSAPLLDDEPPPF